MLKVRNLQCEFMKEPLGISISMPFLSWQAESSLDNILQTGYRLIVADNKKDILNGVGSFLDTEKINSSENSYKLSKPITLSSKRYYWSVKIWDNRDEESEWSSIAWFESGLLYESDWIAKWIEPLQRPVLADGASVMGGLTDNMDKNLKPIDERMFNPCPLIRREFEVGKKIKRSRLYATAHGIYSLELNGQIVGDMHFMPEATPYDKFIQYQTYDITDMLIDGKNVIGAILSDGWWAGRIGNNGWSCSYGNMLALLLQIRIEYEDGSIETIGTDSAFNSFEGPWRYADISVGEKYDARYECEGWSKAGFDDHSWQKVNECGYGVDMLVGQNAEPIKIVERLCPVSIFTSQKGETIVDFGQVITGNASFCLQGKRGQVVEFDHTIQLDKDGNFWLQIMGANNHQRDTYVFKGENEEKYEPRFTCRSFRYVRVTGYDRELIPEKIEARMIASALSFIGDFNCSDDRVNRLQKNIQYSLISTMISIPCDDSDRERAGWTGDAQMLSPTTNFNLNMFAFWKRWLYEMRIEQFQNGAVPCVIPFWKFYKAIQICNYACGWSDACIILPWETYKAYGDKDVLADNFDMMKKWMDFVMSLARENNPADIGEITPERKKNLDYLWNSSFQFGDWLTPSATVDEKGNFMYFATPLDRFTPCFYTAYCSELMSMISEVLEKPADALYYKDLAKNIRNATISEYFDSGFIMNSKFQGATVLALKMGFIPEEKREEALERLLELIAQNDGCLDTGFVSTQHLLDVLTDAGKVEAAYDLLFNEKMPSWLYQVKKGATSIWETWDAITPDGELRPVAYDLAALGTVGDWLYRTVAGINCIEPGYKKSLIAPVLDPKGRLTYAKAKKETPYGDLSSKWELKDGRIRFEVEIPANTQAEIRLPEIKSVQGVTVNGTAINKVLAVDIKEANILKTGSGSYLFEYELE